MRRNWLSKTTSGSEMPSTPLTRRRKAGDEFSLNSWQRDLGVRERRKFLSVSSAQSCEFFRLSLRLLCDCMHSVFRSLFSKTVLAVLEMPAEVMFWMRIFSKLGFGLDFESEG